MILVLNAGSSSLKFKLFDIKNNQLTQVESGSVNDVGKLHAKNHAGAVSLIMQKTSRYHQSIDTIGHRIVFGGEGVHDGEIVNSSVINNIKKYSYIAPLHNPGAVATIVAAKKTFKNAKHRAYYDTSYFNSLPILESVIPIDQGIAHKYHIVRHGFHGISHRYASESSGDHGYERIITLHLGAGSSLTAIRGGKPMATSMGFTPLSGIPMLTRPGDIDPGVIMFLIKMIGIRKTDHMISNLSGMTGIVGKNVNIFDILYMADEKIEDDEYAPEITQISEKERQRAKFAIELFCCKIKQCIGAYAAILGGVDALIFTGRAGAGSSVIRDKVCNGLDYLNLKEVIVVTPNEELAIAKMIIEVN